MRKSLCERRCENDVVKEVRIRCEKDTLRMTLWDRRCGKYIVKSCCEKDVVRKTFLRKRLLERHCEKNIVRKML